MEQINLAISWWQLAGMGGTLATAIAGGVFALMRWSIVRNIQALDRRFDALEERMDKTDERLNIIYQRQEDLRREAITKVDCSTCRRECQDRDAAYKREILEWMRRQDDKLDSILMIVANLNKGICGVPKGN